MIDVGADIKHKTLSEKTVFHIACIRENVEAMKMILNYDLEIVQSVLRMKDIKGETPLDIATWN